MPLTYLPDLAISTGPAHLRWLVWMLAKVHQFGQSPSLIVLGALFVSASWLLRRMRKPRQAVTEALSKAEGEPVPATVAKHASLRAKTVQETAAR